MPRGVPNTRKDETGMRYTTFNVPNTFNPKHTTSTYLKSEAQTLWARNSAKKGKGPATDDAPPDQRYLSSSLKGYHALKPGSRGSQVIVIHPGSRFIRIGKASDVNPVSVPCVVARKCRTPYDPPPRPHLVARPKAKNPTEGGESSLPHDDPFEHKLSSISVSLRDRMRFYKLRVTPNATKIASTFNEQFKPERIAEHNDYQTEWIDGMSGDMVLVGEQALRLANPREANYMVNWPIHGIGFNARNYSSTQMILSDLELLIQVTLEEKLNIPPAEFKNYSVMLVIPDLYDRAYVRELADLLLVRMGFKQLCAQQESLAATYGAGISSACVVNIGATASSVACVDEGLVLADTRMTLNVGGDDITEFLYVLLTRINFPYREIDLNNWYDWSVMENLKSRLCTLADTDVALNLYDFVVRRPGKLTEKYGLRAYDEVILAPMCLFEPRVIEFDAKRRRFRALSENVTEEILLQPTDLITNAMVISTEHLMPAEPPTEVSPVPQPSAANEPNQGTADGPKADHPMDVDNNASQEQGGDPDIAPEVLGGEDTKPGLGRTSPPVDLIPAPPPPMPTPAAPQHPGGYPIDVAFEASKLPLDVAIYNSARAAGGDEKIRKYLQAVLVIGGTALIPGMRHALESRLQAIATPLVANMEKVQIIPPPKEVDPRVLCWKGAAVLGKMDSVSELWITQADWAIFGMRALKERCFYL